MKKLILMLGVLTLMACTKTIYVPQETIKIEYMDRVKVDSVNIHDSVYIKESVKNDTVYLTELRWRTEYKLKEVHDTTYNTKVEYVDVPVEKIVEVEKKLSWWQRLRLRLGTLFLVMLIGAVIGGVIYAVRKGWWGILVNMVKNLFGR